MNCSTCGKALDSDSKFCASCGTPVAQAFEGYAQELFTAPQPSEEGEMLSVSENAYSIHNDKKENIEQIKGKLNSAKNVAVDKINELDLKSKASSLKSGLAAIFTNSTPVIYDSDLRCSKCHISLPEGANFCDVCGAPAEEVPAYDEQTSSIIICKGCGALIPQDSHFCDKCGTAIEIEKKEEENNEAENKLCCPRCSAELPEGSLFCDMCGSRLEESNQKEDKI